MPNQHPVMYCLPIVKDGEDDQITISEKENQLLYHLSNGLVYRQIKDIMHLGKGYASILTMKLRDKFGAATNSELISKYKEAYPKRIESKTGI